MKFILEINCDNVAFERSPEVEVSYILDNISKRVEDGEVEGNVKDTNGDTVGKFEFTFEPGE